MSIIRITNITPAGAYMAAMNAAHTSDRQARKQKRVSSGSPQKTSHGAWYSLPVKITAAGMVFAGYIMGAALVVIVAI